MADVVISYFTKGYLALQPHLVHVPLYFSAPQSIVGMFAVLYISKFAHVFLSFVLLQRYDNVQANYRNGGFDGKSWRHRTVQRAYNAHQNHWEQFIGFSIAMLLAINQTTTEKHAELALIGNAFIVQRLVYNFFYIIAFNEPLSFIRSAVFGVGMILIVRIFAIALTN